MPVSDKARSGEKCRLDEVLNGLYPNKDQRSINNMKEGIKKKLKGMDAVQMKEALKDMLPEVLPNIENRDKAIDDIVKDILNEEGAAGEKIFKTPKYPDCTPEAQEECKKVVKIANRIKNDISNPVVSVFTHEDGTVSVGVSGNGQKTENYAKELQEALNVLEPGKYKVCGKTDEDLMDRMKESGRGVPGNKLGQCAEPKAASAASENKSPITGMDTRWRLGDAPERYQYTSDKSQMAPCDTCKAYEDIYMEHANKNK